MRFIRERDLRELLVSKNNLVTAADCATLPVVDVVMHNYIVDISYNTMVEACNEEEAERIVMEKIMNGSLPFAESAIWKDKEA